MMWQSEHTIESADITPEAIWRIWADVANWNQWDHEIKWSHCEGDFALGSRISVKPVKGFKGSGKITVCEPNQSLVTVMQLSLCTRMEFAHFVTQVGDKVKVIHRVTIKGPLTFLFKYIIGKQVAKNLPIAMGNLLRLAMSS